MTATLILVNSTDRPVLLVVGTEADDYVPLCNGFPCSPLDTYTLNGCPGETP